MTDLDIVSGKLDKLGRSKLTICKAQTTVKATAIASVTVSEIYHIGADLIQYRSPGCLQKTIIPASSSGTGDI